MKLIKHNQKQKAHQIFNNAKNIRVYTLDNGFSGKEANKLDYEGKNWLQYQWDTFKFARLSLDGDGTYHLHITMRCWYEFIN